jgi:hypothetical protein
MDGVAVIRLNAGGKYRPSPRSREAGPRVVNRPRVFQSFC